jgi:hypothetical protein
VTRRACLVAVLALTLSSGCSKDPVAARVVGVSADDAPMNAAMAKFSGKIANDPERVFTVEVDQVVSARAAEISDWMYVDTGKLVGGYTVRVLRDRFSPSDRAEFDRSMPFRVE